MSFKQAAKWMMALTPYRIVRSPPNRYQAIGYCLRHLRRLGYEPRRIVDGGACLGEFALEASAIFPTAVVHLVDPQPACRSSLETLAAERGFVFHPYALSSEPGRASMICLEAPTTGARLTTSPVNASWRSVDVEAASLDSLFFSVCKPTDRTLLKLDLQGHEPQALKGASRMLEYVEVALVEVSFVGRADEVTMPTVFEFFYRNGFELFDIASLSGRPRDNRLREGDFIFVRRGSKVSIDIAWH